MTETSKNVHEDEKTAYMAESQAVLNKVLVQLGADDALTPVVVTKNDATQKRVHLVCEQLDKSGVVFLVAKSNAILKLVAAVELVKSSRKGLKQYNKLTSQSSLINPNYTHSKSTARQKSNPDDFYNDVSDSVAIHGPKVYDLAILNVLLVEGALEKPAENLAFRGWTPQ